MTEGFYTDPKQQKLHRAAKIAVVITFFDAGDKNYRDIFIENKKQTLLMNLKAHAHFDPGVAYDLIIVNHGGLENIMPKDLVPPDGMQRLLFLHDAPNFGISMGGWKQAWEYFGEDYDYYCFCEDDIAPTKDGWLLDLLAKYHSAGDVGAVGNFVEGRSPDESGSPEFWEAAGTNHTMMYNFDGGYTFTSTRVLNEVDNAGGLLVVDCGPGSKYAGTVNEVIFQQPILELGYRILSFADGKHFLVHGSEIFTNDLMFREGPFAPLLNLNGRHMVPELKELFKFLEP